MPKIIGIVNSRNEELAKAYWQGKGLNYYEIRNLDDENTFMPLDESPTGVYPILETIEITAGGCRPDAKILCVK